MIITQTPFRMSFFGGGTDMESFFRENGGAVLSTTFDKYCYVNVRHLPRFFDYSTELSYSKTERVTCIEDIQHPAIRNKKQQKYIGIVEKTSLSILLGKIKSATLMCKIKIALSKLSEKTFLVNDLLSEQNPLTHLKIGW